MSINAARATGEPTTVLATTNQQVRRGRLDPRRAERVNRSGSEDGDPTDATAAPSRHVAAGSVKT
jgi:hypothetical protein